MLIDKIAGRFGRCNNMIPNEKVLQRLQNIYIPTIGFLKFKITLFEYPYLAIWDLSYIFPWMLLTQLAWQATSFSRTFNFARN